MPACQLAMPPALPHRRHTASCMAFPTGLAPDLAERRAILTQRPKRDAILCPTNFLHRPFYPGLLQVQLPAKPQHRQTWRASNSPDGSDLLGDTEMIIS